jgi:hypothetical protein
MMISVFCAASSEERFVVLRVLDEPLGRVVEGACRVEDLDGFDEVLEEVEEREEEEGMLMVWRMQYVPAIWAGRSRTGQPWEGSRN